MNNNQKATGGQVIELMQHISPAQVMQISDRFEQIIACQLHLMLQRGVPAEKLIELVTDINNQMKAAEMQEIAQASGQ